MCGIVKVEVSMSDRGKERKGERKIRVRVCVCLRRERPDHKEGGLGERRSVLSLLNNIPCVYSREEQPGNTLVRQFMLFEKLNMCSRILHCDVLVHPLLWKIKTFLLLSAFKLERNLVINHFFHFFSNLFLVLWIFAVTFLRELCFDLKKNHNFCCFIT